MIMKLLCLNIIFIISILFFDCHKSKRFENSPIDLEKYPKLKEIVENIERGERIEGSQIGESGAKSVQHQRYLLLQKHATETQLISLTEHKSPVVRCYAFQILANTKSNKTFSILLKHLDDTTKIETVQGCIGWSTYAGDYFINASQLSLNEQRIMDSIMLNDRSIILTGRLRIIENLKPIESNYNKIRELVEVERNTSALITLAKFRKLSDRDLIITFLKNEETKNSALLAVKEFPDIVFYPYVKKYLRKNGRKKSMIFGFGEFAIKHWRNTLIKKRSSFLKKLLIQKTLLDILLYVLIYLPQS
jgi:hypothetical protein